MSDREEYRGHTLTRAPMGHVNITRDGGFCGGYPSFAAARRAVDQAADTPRYEYKGPSPYTGRPMYGPVVILDDEPEDLEPTGPSWGDLER